MAPFVLLGLNSPNCYALFIFPSKDDESQEDGDFDYGDDDSDGDDSHDLYVGGLLEALFLL